jgi:hypothetical protein
MSDHGLKDYEVTTALRFFMYHMPMEQRSQLMAEFPVIYNKLVGSEIAVSVPKRRLDSLNFLATTLPDHNGNVPGKVA